MKVWGVLNLYKEVVLVKILKKKILVLILYLNNFLNNYLWKREKGEGNGN